jgi:hypothetical protein
MFKQHLRALGKGAATIVAVMWFALLIVFLPMIF